VKKNNSWQEHLREEAEREAMGASREDVPKEDVKRRRVIIAPTSRPSMGYYQKKIILPDKTEWPVMHEAAMHGLAGRVVRTIEPHTEADPNAILMQFLVAAGNAVGPNPCHFRDGDYHRCKLFAVLAGITSKARKGTSWNRVRQVMSYADPEWVQERVNSGLSSGEGIIYHVRDPVTKLNEDGEIAIVDRGVPDKRLMLITEEFAGALSVMQRPGNTLSPVLRDAWGSATLQTLIKHSPDRATGTHISLIAHITDDELRSLLTTMHMATGFANRLLFMRAKRSKELAMGGNIHPTVLEKLGGEVGEVILNAQALKELTLTPAATKLWQAIYHDLSSPKPGLFGAIIGRAEAQATRLAILYAVLDGSNKIDLAHMDAALAVWAFCEESARQIFGDTVGDPIADVILKALQVGPMTRTEISGLFHRHTDTRHIDAALELLRKAGKARRRYTPTRGRSIETWQT
jgi:Protein of unknown function (DUF3987)